VTLVFTYSPSNFAAAGPPARKHASHQHEKILLNHHHPDLDDTASPHPTKHPNLLIFPQTSIGGSRTARTPPQKEKARAGDGAGFGVTRRKTGIVVLLSSDLNLHITTRKLYCNNRNKDYYHCIM
ncbi:hypothetical protein IHA17_000301, partial [Salmonella enterica]|nr:hypothetical protein [Salmonella enterica]